MGIKRIVDINFWNDDKVLEMFSPEDKLFMLYLLTNPHTTQLGIYPINIKHIAFELGYSLDTVKVLLERFENKYKIIKYDYTTKEIAIKNYLIHSIIKGGAPVRDCLVKEIKAVKNRDLIAYVFGNIKDNELLNATVKKLINEYEEANGEIMYTNKKEKHNNNDNNNNNNNNNDNDNDNEVSYPVSLNDTSNDTFEKLKNREKSTKHKYGTYKRILLTEKEYENLCKEFGEGFVKKQIELLDEYVESNNNKNGYKNFNLVIRKSIRDNWFKTKTAAKKYTADELDELLKPKEITSETRKAIEEAYAKGEII